MTQLLLNLVQNALAASKEKGGDLEVWLRARREGDEVVLEVEDRGVGMTAEQMDQMFDLFYSTRKGGTGLGLAVVQRIAKAHEARLEVISSPDQGTRVQVILPLSGSKSVVAGSSPRERKLTVAEEA